MRVEKKFINKYVEIRLNLWGSSVVLKGLLKKEPERYYYSVETCGPFNRMIPILFISREIVSIKLI